MAVVFEEILPSPVEHDTSEPAGISCPPASAKSGGAKSRERTRREVRFIVGLQGESFFDQYADTFRTINLRETRVDRKCPRYMGKPTHDAKVSFSVEKYFWAM
jgi:hypothetical protein